MWDTIIIKPLAALLMALYELTKNYGVAIILFSLTTKLLMLFFSAKGKRSTMNQQRLAPKQQELQRLYGKDKQKYNEELMKLYQESGVSPMGGCLWMLLPLPIFFALYAVIREPLKNLMGLDAGMITQIQEYFINSGFTFKDAGFLQLELAQLMSSNETFARLQAALPEIADNIRQINFDFFAGFNLTQIPNLPWKDGGWNLLLIIPFLSCGTQYLSTYLTQKFNGTNNQMQGNMKVMFMLMPLMSLWFGFIMPAAMGLYWTIGNLLGIVQEYFLTKYYKKKMAEEDARKAELAAKRKAAEEKFHEEERLRKLEAGEGSGTKNMSNKKKYRLKNSSLPAGQKKAADKPQSEE